MSRLYKTVKDYSKAIGVLPPVVLFKLDLWSETLSFSDVYNALPQSLRTRIGEERKFIKEKWDEFFSKPLFNVQSYKDFLAAMGYPLAHVSTPVSGYEGKILVLVSPYDKECVHANKVYLTIQEIEARYRPAFFSTNKENNYVDHILGFYKGMSRPWSEGESGSSNRYILANEDNIESIEGLLETISTFGQRFVEENFVQYMLRVTEGIKDDLEKVKLPR